MKRIWVYTLFCLTAGVSTVAVSATASAEVSAETAFIFNTLSFLIHGFLVMWMAAGFCMLEAGLVRSKNTTMQCSKNIGLYSIAGIMFWLLGYNLMYSGVDGGWVGSPSPWAAADPAITADGFKANDANVYAAGSDWFFQMVFVAAAGSIVSGTVAERIKVFSFFIFIIVLTGIIYPIQGSWTWGGGWLSEKGFSDFAGSTIVHSVGGWAALTGAVIIGARKGKYSNDGQIMPMPGANLPLATLGTFILWLGWFGFNGGSQLAMGSAADAVAISAIYINTNLAAAGGVIGAILLNQVLYKKLDLTMALNGALGGLVAITAEPLAPTPGLAILIGGIGGFIIVLTVPLLDKMKIDDVVGAIPVHLFCGIWGTLAVVISNAESSLITQIIGIISIGLFVIVMSSVTWFIIKIIFGLRPTEEEELIGLDKTECGMDAYPEFK
ncbi:ammonium transporter [Alphaproteobacteria bacterium]|nr:ammonium transporter [Rhodospirillaceae bacterium]MBT6306904.1 ammonium transporter [Rhodospirillaceae bacterium]MBT7730339.1 ammonium transporter [Rhodospirillaceae bacterium]MDC0999219.1 ammonium transporter [Alphaproteobacteria bacterium]